MKEQPTVGILPQTEVVPMNRQRLVEQPTSPDLFRGLPDGFEVPRDSNGRIRWSQLATDPQKLQLIIEHETEGFIASGNPLTFRSLLENNRSDLLGGMRRHYPEGLRGIQEHFGLTSRKKRKPKEYFQSPEHIKEEAQAFLGEYGGLRNADLRNAGREDLYQSVIVHYPGGWQHLRQELGITSKTYRRRTMEDIKREAFEFAQQEGGLTVPLLTEKGRTDLTAVISRRYPGKLMQLRVDLGLDVGQRGNDYWQNPQNVEDEAEQFYKTYGKLDQNTLKVHDRVDLWAAIYRYYPGRWQAIREKLKIPRLDVPARQHPNGYWTPEMTLEGAQKFLQENGVLDRKQIKEARVTGLSDAISHYPGGWSQLRRDLWLDVKRRQWSEEEILEEARKVFEGGGRLTPRWLRENRLSGLWNAIYKKYPGGVRALREKLGIDQLGQPPISPDQANEQLAKLMEATK